MKCENKGCRKEHDGSYGSGKFCSLGCSCSREMDRYITLSEPFEKMGFDRKRYAIIFEQKGRCRRCQIDKWMGRYLSLEIDHIDGNRKNNSRENLEALCPNCHSQTDTFRGKNKKTSEKISDEEYMKVLKKHPKSIYAALNELGLAPKGANYKRAKRLMMTLDIYEGYAILPKK